MQQRAVPESDELASVIELAGDHDMGESTAWLLIRRHNLERFRLPNRGKTTFVRRSDFERALQTPIPIQATESTKKAAA